MREQTSTSRMPREGRHDPGMILQIVRQPGAHILRRAGILHQVGAPGFARRRAEFGIGNREGAGQHGLLFAGGVFQRGQGAGRRQRLKMAVRSQRRLEIVDLVEIELQRQLGRDAVVEIEAAHVPGREDQALGQAGRRRDEVADETMLGVRQLQAGVGRIVHIGEPGKAHPARLVESDLSGKRARPQFASCLSARIAAAEEAGRYLLTLSR